MIRSIILGATLLLAPMSALAQSGQTYEVRRPPQATPPPIQATPEEVEFNDVMPESANTMAVTLVNTGTEALEVLSVRTSCNCTTTDLPTKILLPGEPVTMQATLDADRFMGKVRRNIAIFCKGYSQPKQVFVSCWVNYGVRATVRYDTESNYRKGVLTLEDPDGTPFSVLSTNGQTPVFADGFDPATDAPRGTYQLQIDMSDIPDEELPTWYLVETDHPTAPVIDIRVMGNDPPRVRRPWQISDARILLWRLKPGESTEVEFILRNLVGDPLTIIEKITFSDPGVEVAMQGMTTSPEGLTVRMRVSPDPGYSGVIDGTLAITAQGHRETVDLIGAVHRP